jgi:hypothetical protein
LASVDYNRVGVSKGVAEYQRMKAGVGMLGERWMGAVVAAAAFSL